MAVRAELMRRFDLPELVDDKPIDLTLIETGVEESRTIALEWIVDAQTELDRRQDDRTLGLQYWRGRALLSAGDLEGAQAAFEQALAERSIESWRLRRLLALTLLYRGDLDGALVQAFRASIDSPASDRYIADYVLALVLDRAGDTAGSRRRMKDTLDRDSDGGRMRSLEAALPMHERLYLRAFAQTVRNEASGAMRLWDAYLARPEPETPERRLAERHRQALEPLPTNLGGPAKPGEAPPSP
jgi:tetratricopeptide (TPR) repeat protein